MAEQKKVLPWKAKWREKSKGSFTVEAALLMTLILPLLVAVIYMGFYQHDKAWIANKARTAAVEMVVDKDRKNNTDWSGVLASSRVSGMAKSNGKCAQVYVKGGFSFPGMAANFFTGSGSSVNCEIEIPVKYAKKEIQKYRNLKRLTEE